MNLHVKYIFTILIIKQRIGCHLRELKIDVEISKIISDRKRLNYGFFRAMNSFS